MDLRIAPILGLLLLGGCAYNVAEQTDRMVADMARKTFDREPATGNVPAAPAAAATPDAPDLSKSAPAPKGGGDIQTTSYLEAQVKDPVGGALKLEVPPGLPGSEVPKIPAKLTKEELIQEAARLYPPLPLLPEEPKAQPGPNGKAFSLADLQELAVMNSPALKQAASDVKAAEGNLVQARTYQNPTMGYRWDPSNDGSTASVQGMWIDQKISTGGKMKLGIAAAQKTYDNSVLALKKARSDLSTAVRNAYFGLLVAKETVRVNYALSVLTDEIYRTQASLMNAGQSAAYEPATLRAQAYSARLAQKQAITSYLFAWKQVVATVGLRQLPLSEVSGRVDAFIPYFDYDQVAQYVLKNHTDVLTAQNGIDIARYNLKLAQITPWFSDLDVNIAVEKEFALLPLQWFMSGAIGFTVPLWDRNRGNIMAAEAALIRAAEQPHFAELNLTNNLQNAYTNYKNNLDGLNYYRRYILPDQVRYYRGVLTRRQLDPNAQFGDLVQAQQTLASNVSSYLTILGQLWTSAVQVADFLQTDDLFALARPEAVPALPNFAPLLPLPCCHGEIGGTSAGPSCASGACAATTPGSTTLWQAATPQAPPAPPATVPTAATLPAQLPSSAPKP
jgi:outer membrane protein, heavy metal efflux system